MKCGPAVPFDAGHPCTGDCEDGAGRNLLRRNGVTAHSHSSEEQGEQRNPGPMECSRFVSCVRVHVCLFLGFDHAPLVPVVSAPCYMAPARRDIRRYKMDRKSVTSTEGLQKAPLRFSVIFLRTAPLMDPF